MEEKKPEPNPLIKKYRKVCQGCYNDRYNHKSDGERPGIDAPTSGEGCWSLEYIERNKCKVRR